MSHRIFGALAWVPVAVLGCSQGGANQRLVGKPAEDGRCVVTVADDQFLPVAVALDGASIYWANADDGTIVWAPEGASPPPPVILASGQSSPAHLVVDDAGVYWTTSDGKVVASPKALAAGQPVIVATISPGVADYPSLGVAGLASNGADLFWVAPTGSLDALEAQVTRAPRGGGAQVVVATSPGLPVAVVADGVNVYWAAAVPTSPDLTQGVGQVLAAPVGGGAPQVLATTDFAIGGLALDAHSVYFSTPTSIESVPIGGGAPVVLASSVARAPALATDGTSVYFTSADGDLVKVPAGGGPGETLARGQGGTASIAVGASGVVLAVPSLGTGTIVQVEPK